MNWRNRVEVSYKALADNAQRIQALAAPRQLIAVVKADAYGLGLERCARIYHEAGALIIAVAALSEADRVRRAVPQARILLLGSPLPEERAAVIASAYEVCCTSAEEITEFASLARHERQRVHLFIDTGMGRAGCLPAQAPELVQRILASPSLHLAGIASHYPMALNDAVSTTQEAILAQVLAALPPLPEDCLIHLANSEGLVVRPPIGQAVRIGLLLTGAADPSLGHLDLQPTMRWVSSVSVVKALPAGHGISYQHQHVLDRDSIVALIPVGYADGYPLALSGRGQVLIQGRRVPILGRVTMDYVIVDVSDLPHQPRPGEEVVLIGRQDDEEITVTELARLADTLPYDILCGLRGRCEVVGVP